MKKILFVLLFFGVATTYSQKNPLYIDIGTLPQRIQSNVYEATLNIRSNSTNDVDYYTFNIIADIGLDGKLLDKGFLIPTTFKSSNFDLEKMEPCAVHDLLSKQGIIVVQKDKLSDSYFGWHAIYMGTYRNLVITHPGRL